MFVLGPCAAESREQVIAIAKALSTFGEPFVYRAGVWKPRTSPDTFQGIGDIGLQWLQEVQETLHIPCATEVATADQVQKALNAGITRLWIGARTSANPIAIQALANALDERVQEVYIKNPVNNDPALWIGNIHRFEKAVKVFPHTHPAIYAVHRGCNHQPCWSMAYTLRQQRPDIPLLLDPSHISGDAAKIPALMEMGHNLQYNGYMIEIHNHPTQALSDAAQQITPQQFMELATRLIIPTYRHTDIPNEELQRADNAFTDLLWLRAQIDEVDEVLWNTILQRMDIVRQISTLKRNHQIAPFQPTRYQQLLQTRLQWAKENGLPESSVQPILDAIHALSLSIQS